MARTKLPDGATAVPVGINGEHIIVTPANAFHPPRAEFIKGGRKTYLVPADLIEKFADVLDTENARKLRQLVAALRGEPAKQ